MEKLNERIHNGSHKKTRMMERMSKCDVNILEDMVPKLPRITGLVYDKTLKRWRSIVPSIYSSKRVVRYFSVRKYGFKKAWLKALHHICSSIISHLMNNAKRRNSRISYSDVESESDCGSEDLILNKDKLDRDVFQDINKVNLDKLNTEMGTDGSDYDLLYPLFRYMISTSMSGEDDCTDEDTQKLRAAFFDGNTIEPNSSPEDIDMKKSNLLENAITKVNKVGNKITEVTPSPDGLDKLTNYETKQQASPSDSDYRLYSLRKNPKRSSRIDENYFITNENSIEMLTFDDEICNMFRVRNQDSSSTDTLSGEGINNSFYNAENKLESSENSGSDSDDHSRCKDDSLSRNLRNVDFDKYIKALDLFDDESGQNHSGDINRGSKKTLREARPPISSGKAGKFEALLAATRSSTKNSPPCDKVEDQSKIANSLRPWHQCIVWIPSISRWRTLYYDDMSVKHTKTFTPAVFGGVEAAYYAAVEFRNMIDNMNGLTSLATIRRTWNKTGASIKHTREEMVKSVNKRKESFAESRNDSTEDSDYSKGAKCAHNRTSKRKKIQETTNETNTEDGYSADIQEGLSEHGLLGLDAKYLCMPIPINWQSDCKKYVE